MKKRLICIILSLAVVVGMAAYSSTYTWFSSGEKKVQELVAGNMRYALTGEFQSVENTDILPGVNIVKTPYSIQNLSNIDTQLRLKIVCTYLDESKKEQIYTYTGESESSVLSVDLDNSWVAIPAEGYFYYGGKSGETSIVKPGSESIPLFTSLMYQGSQISQANSNAKVKVTITIESKQAYYVTWTTIDTLYVTGA